MSTTAPTSGEPTNITADVDFLAREMQSRDARHWGAVIDGVAHPDWDEISQTGRDEYRADAAWAVMMLVDLRGYTPGGMQ